MPSSAPIRPDATRARYEKLLEVAESIAAHRQLSTLLADLSRRLKELVSFDFITITQVDPKDKMVRLHVLQAERPLAGTPPEGIPFDESPTGVVLRSRHPYYVPRTSEEQASPVIRELLLSNGIRSYCTVPLVTAQHDLGALTFGSLEEDAYSD